MHEIRVSGAKLAAKAGPNQAGSPASSGAAETACADKSGSPAAANSGANRNGGAAALVQRVR